MKKQKKNNFIVLKTLLCLILLGAIAFGIFAYRFARVSIKVSSETGKLKVNDILCKIRGMDEEEDFNKDPILANTYYGNGMVYGHDYYISFELNNQFYELCFSYHNSSLLHNAPFYVSNVEIVVNVLEDDRIKILVIENGKEELEEIFEKDDELYISLSII